jgi:hypothetical protein
MAPRSNGQRGRSPEVHDESQQPTSVDLQPLADVQKYLTQYAREKPEYCALGCLFVGFVLGWKLKPW